MTISTAPFCCTPPLLAPRNIAAALNRQLQRSGHQSYLLCEWHDLQVGVNAAQAVLLQLCLDVLSDQVNGHYVVTLLPWNDDVSIPAA